MSAFLFLFCFSGTLIGILWMLFGYWSLNHDHYGAGGVIAFISGAVTLIVHTADEYRDVAQVRPEKIIFAVIEKDEKKWVELYYNGLRADITKKDHVDIFCQQGHRMRYFVEYSTKVLKDKQIENKLIWQIVEEKAVESKKN